MDMEPNPKNIDCYFYYYSECRRANQCKFRHEPSARGCETMCQKWKEGTCTDQHCSLRHMELKKKRKEIPCYWEKQPSGCTKAHCAFQHQFKGNQSQVQGQAAAAGDKPTSEDASSENSVQDWNRRVHSTAVASYEPVADPANVEAARRLSQSGPDSYGSPPVDPLVVNFEEESDSESAPSWTPTKVPKEEDTLHVKTLEEIRLEKIQAESAAYWEGIAGGPMAWEAANPATSATRKSFNSQQKSVISPRTLSKELDFRILSLDEIRRNRSRKTEEADSSNKVTDSKKLNELYLKKCAVNGHANVSPKDMKAKPGITDLRSKLGTNDESQDNSSVSSSLDPWNSKRQHADSSFQDVPSKKQRIRLRKLSDMMVPANGEMDSSSPLS